MREHPSLKAKGLESKVEGRKEKNNRKYRKKKEKKRNPRLGSLPT